MRIVQNSLTFDDVLLVPARSSVLPREANLAARLTRNVALNIPIVSSAMDTVTEARLAIALAQEGGLGIIHKNMSVEAQAREVAKVKRSNTEPREMKTELPGQRQTRYDINGDH